MYNLLVPIPNRVVAALCIVAIAFAAIVPGAAGFDQASFEGEWVLLPPVTSATVAAATDVVPEQPLALAALLPSRAPPAMSLT